MLMPCMTVCRYGHRFPDGTYRTHSDDSGRTTDLSEAHTYADRNHAELILAELRQLNQHGAKVVPVTITYQDSSVD